MVMQGLKDQMLFIGFQGQFPVSFEYRCDGPVMKHLDPTFDGTLKCVFL